MREIKQLGFFHMNKAKIYGITFYLLNMVFFGMHFGSKAWAWMRNAVGVDSLKLHLDLN
jgi:hypothetical protein